MLPPVMELYVIWHPDDALGRRFAQDLLHHFHGRRFTGLIGGSIDVFLRSAAAGENDDSPRPIDWPDGAAMEARQADLTVLVPCLSLSLGRAALDESSAWSTYLNDCAQASRAAPSQVLLLPALSDSRVLDNPWMRELFTGQEIVLRSDDLGRRENCRELAQAIAQKAEGTGERLTIFISHTKSSGKSERGVAKLIDQVRERIEETRLDTFFDATDLQIGENWDAALRERVAQSALLALRTDLYASRTWCQREMRIAKTNGMPVVVLDALTNGEERGSFLMDHVPRVSLHRQSKVTRRASIDRALTLLVDESLKRVLWRRQQQVAPRDEASRIDWWAPHAPEPSTLTEWIGEHPDLRDRIGGRALRILHPDPPLGPDERDILDLLGQNAGFSGGVEVMTPAMLSARLDQPELALLPDNVLRDVRLGISVSQTEDLPRLGLAEEHLRLALGEVARMVLVFGGSVAYGGHLDASGYSAFLAGELQRFGRGDQRLLLTLPWSEHRKLSLAELEEREDALGLLAKVVYLNYRGVPISKSSDRNNDACAEEDPAVRAEGLSSMRLFQLEHTAAHLVIGGRRTGYQGRMPGVLEEVRLSLKAQKPLFLAGGFGGVARDAAVKLGLVHNDSVMGGLRSYPEDVEREFEDLLPATPEGVVDLQNGLSVPENRELATTPRAGRVAALVALGLSTLQHKSGAESD